MLIEFTCANCRAALRVREQDQGKQARCPRCGAHTPVTQASERTLPSDGVHWLRGPDGAVYGPCTSAEIRGWVLEGRVDNRFQVRTEPHASWQSMYGVNVHVTAFSSGDEPALGKRPHRGGRVLMLGLAGLLCFPMSIMAWMAGRKDLVAMRDGEMDSRGRGVTQAGMILGVISATYQLYPLIQLVLPLFTA